MLRASGWTVTAFVPGRALSNYSAHALTEFPTVNGPADYALVVDGQLLGIVEAKKITLGPQNVLTQAERYSKGVLDGPIKARTGVDSYRVPFLYSTNGEVIWFHDVRHRLNRSRRIAHFHTPSALRDAFSRDLDAACRCSPRTRTAIPAFVPTTSRRRPHHSRIGSHKPLQKQCAEGSEKERKGQKAHGP